METKVGNRETYERKFVDIFSPIPAKVDRALVAPASRVHVGDQLVIMEEGGGNKFAVTSPVDGVVDSLHTIGGAHYGPGKNPLMIIDITVGERQRKARR